MQENEVVQAEKELVPCLNAEGMEVTQNQSFFADMEENPLPEFADLSDTPILFYQLLLMMLLVALLLLCYFLFPQLFEELRSTMHQFFDVNLDFVAWGKTAGEALQTMLTVS